ncbi:IS3 family transposase [Lachnospiraceae bacterium MD329]|nr:IS3 family transposase [Lachnospiraceae bacterium MD329]
MGQKCIDNGPMEGFWGIIKTEMYYLNKFDNYSDLESAIAEFIRYYNNNRYQERLNCMTPMEYHKYLNKAS